MSKKKLGKFSIAADPPTPEELVQDGLKKIASALAEPPTEKFSQEKFDSERQTIPGEPDYAEIALAKLRSIARDASAEISARVLAVEALHARGEIGLEPILHECLSRRAPNGQESLVRAARTLLEIAEKK